MVALYGEDTEPGTKPTAGDMTVFLLVRDDAGEAVGCGGLRALDERRCELKRMYVRPAARRRGHARALLAALEQEALARGFVIVRLEAGDRQPEAVALYASAGYEQVPCGSSASHGPHSVCMAKRLAPG
jgi:putative acetyltransferase